MKLRVGILRILSQRQMNPSHKSVVQTWGTAVNAVHSQASKQRATLSCS